MPHHLRELHIEEFNYPLPDGRIAQFPLESRDRSKLLVYRQGQISEDVFSHITGHLPAKSLIVFNESRVIHARLIFRKPSGARIEVFCLEPLEHTDIQLAFQGKGSVSWKCLVGNARRWKAGTLEMDVPAGNERILLRAEKGERVEDAYIVHFSWDPPHFTFAGVLEAAGKIPLPPYISREVTAGDADRYQTFFARNEGSVAAPTAGLHFTDAVFQSLQEKGITAAKITLHVGAGTFKPVSSPTVNEHLMHTEQVLIPVQVIRQLLEYHNKHITLVGTTTVRAVESIYWQGVKWLYHNPAEPFMRVEQWDPYDEKYNTRVPVEDSLGKVLEVLESKGLSHLQGSTSLLIAPGYTYRFPTAIVTNFHQPKSTLLLLVAAFLGADWKKAYEYALQNDFRFLSYGDSCLFFRGAGNTAVI
jgi:S-adenosylmethionine:tRNA ribosyltransferase-isomerase